MKPLLIAIALLWCAKPAFADVDVTGTYDVKFEEVGNGCDPPPITLARSKLVVAERKGSLTVNIDTIPQMFGVPEKAGKVTATTAKIVPTTMQGLDARYSISGKVEEGGVVTFVLTAEYQRHDNRRPYCTQSWNVRGPRADKN